jgi:hypothetical protein
LHQNQTPALPIRRSVTVCAEPFGSCGLRQGWPARA